MTVHNLTPGGYAANCYLLTEGDTAVLIDATASPARVQRVLAESGAHLFAVLLTHGHFDHMLTAKQIKDTFGVPFFLHAADAALPGDGEKNASAVFFGQEMTFPPADRHLSGGETRIRTHRPFGRRLCRAPPVTQRSLCAPAGHPHLPRTRGRSAPF